MNFEKLGLTPALGSACESLGYTTPTPIQTKAIPIILTGQDLIGSAETGTGKTAAFLLPIIQKISERSRPGVRVLVLAPTRELALQIQQNYTELNPAKSNRIVVVMGGTNIRTQIAELRRGASVVVATPGRLLDLTERRAIDLSQIEVLVLDEADRMLDMGFLPAIRRILAVLPTKRQTLLFSATMSSDIEQLARSTMNRPKVVEVNRRGSAATIVEQTAYLVALESKTALLLALLEKDSQAFERVLVFTRTRRGAERISHILEAREHKVNRLHADRTQSQRETALRDFKNGRARVLVATDIAARGLDVDDVSHVINYDMPDTADAYTHRIGRTGRAEATGDAFTLMVAEDGQHVNAIERFLGKKIERAKLETSIHTKNFR